MNSALFRFCVLAVAGSVQRVLATHPRGQQRRVVMVKASKHRHADCGLRSGRSQRHNWDNDRDEAERCHHSSAFE